MDRHVAEAIRQQSDDLRDELKELENWEAEVRKAAEAAKLRRAPPQAAVPSVAEIPIRGTVASIKQTLATRTAGSNAAPSPSSSATPPSEAATQKDRGNEFFRKGEVAEAIRCYTRGIEVDPMGSLAHVLYANRAMCHLKRQAWGEAEADATESLKLCRGYAKAFYRRAVARKNLGRLREARADLESVLALSANDAAALAEMETVTHLLQAERVKATTTATAKKRVVIEEVDEEEEEEATTQSTSPAGPSAAVDEEAAQRLSRIDAHVKEVEEVRSRDAVTGRVEALRKEQQMRARLRTSARVEVVEEDPVTEAEPSPPTAKVAQTRASQPDGTSQASIPSSQAAAHTTPSTGASASRKATSSTPSTRVLPTKEALKPATTFTEFERQFTELQDDETLRDYYLGLLHPTTMRSLFGNNLTPEILVALLSTIRQLDPSAALQYLKGVLSINRVSDIALFFNSAERGVAQEAVTRVQENNVSAKEMQQIRSKLHL